MWAYPQVVVHRLVPYWFTVLAVSWICACLYVWASDDAYVGYEKFIVQPLFARFDDEYVMDWAAELICFITPTLIASSIAALFLTSAKLPSWRLSWFNKFFALLRGFGPSCFSRLRAKVRTLFRDILSDADYGHGIAKKNQFAIGEPNFNAMAVWVVFLPLMLGVWAYLPAALAYADDEVAEHPEEDLNLTKLKLLRASHLSGFGGALAMAWFLIPVARHSVLLVAMGWSPVHALRLHIWLGNIAFMFVVVHAGLHFIVWFGFDDIPIYQQFIPPKPCWSPNAQNQVIEEEHANATEATDKATIEEESTCNHQFYNLTGLMAFLFLIVLWGSSLNWVRRRNYRVFYILHIVFGTLFLLGCILHFKYMALYFLPSTAYYLASTAPTLVQAIASWIRGGVRIEKVVVLEDAGGCVEVHAASNPETNQWLDTKACLYVKLCVPEISLVWHPFTVYKHQADRSTVRFLFRPIGPFTKELARLMPERPITILDGFYRGGDHCLEALQHDQVTIITGGVGITPFLSMIPAIFQALSEQEDKFLKKIDFHWCCRDAGLEAFVTREYLNDIIRQAKGVLETFTVTIYRTGGISLEAGKGNGSYLDTLKQSSTSLEDDSSFDTCSEERESTGGDSSADREHDAVSLHDEESPATLNEGSATMLNKEKNAKQMMNEVAGGKEQNEHGKGRFAEMHWNISLFAMFSGIVWLFFHATFYRHLDTSKQSSTSLEDDSSFDSEERESTGGESSADREQDAVDLGDRKSPATLNEESVVTLDEEKHAKQMMNEAAGSKEETEHHKGFPMELARMMPGRFAQMRWNIPLFVVFSGMVWLFVHVTFFPYSDDRNTFAQMSDETWITMLLISFCFGCGVAIEATVLLFRTHWPAPQPATFDMVTYKKSGTEEGESSLLHVCGRPTVEAMFAQAQSATAPGIFMCGPEGLCAMVKKRARQENSYFGLTRYCLYEEAFEM